MYVVRYDKYTTEPFQIGENVFKRHVWQPTLEYFLPVQMCHMRVNDGYKVWHGLCHMDDALMALTDINHFDGYVQGPSTLTKYSPGEHVPGINIGGWHDAGDYDMRVESQASEIQILAHAFLEFGVDYDNTTVNQDTRVTEIQKPDGKSDILQQIEHGALSIVGGYKSLGRLYRGIISPGLRQYVHLGDAAIMSDNQIYRPASGATASADQNGVSVEADLRELERFSTSQYIEPGGPDDRWVFTEENPRREIGVAAGLAVSSRALKGFNDELSRECLEIAAELFDITQVKDPLMKVEAATELFLATNDKKYSDFLVKNTDAISKNIERAGWVVGRTLPLINNRKYRNSITKAVQAYKAEVDEQEKKTPYGVPYEPNIWGAGWGIQSFGVKQYFLHTGYPEIFPATYMLHAMNFVLGVHPGVNTSSFASGVGSRSLTVAYGVNRDEWSYIPGGVGSGTALIRPDFPELLTWPYLWQQTEYVMGGGATDFMFLVLAADKILDEKP
jgi:endoglucanase